MIPQPQPHIYALVDGQGELNTEAPSRRWAYRTLNPAAQRAHHDRMTGLGRRARVARYKFDGWAT